jgi:hypothetical protein
MGGNGAGEMVHFGCELVCFFDLDLSVFLVGLYDQERLFTKDGMTWFSANLPKPTTA